MRTFLAVVFLLCVILIFVVLGVIIYESLRKHYKYKIKNLSKTILGLVIACFVLGLIDYSLECRENKLKEIQTLSQKNIENKTKVNDSKYSNILESEKSFNDFNEDEKKNFFELIKNWDSQSKSFKEKYESRKKVLAQQKDDELKKEHEKSREEYSLLISDIENDFPEMKVNYICNDEKNSQGKILSMDMNLLENVDSTKYKCCELTVKKETKLKNSGITEITIYIKNNGEHAGLIFFELRGGEYHPTLSHIK